jgi:GMP synthase-like glutamine amidotransferase
VPVVAVLHHLAQAFLGHVERPLRDAGIELDQRHIAHGDPLPRLEGLDGIVMLGGEQSAVEADADPVLRAETELIRQAVAADVPVLGVCLGGQVLAHALGARVRHAGRVIEWRELQRLPSAIADPVFGGVPDPVPALHWNEDVFELPDGAVPLLNGGPEGQGVPAFRHGRAWGVQYHPDVDDAVLAEWLRLWGHWLPDERAFRAQTTPERLAAQARASEAFFGDFARVVLGR